MKRVILFLFAATLFETIVLAQQPKVDLSVAASAMTTTANSLNTLYLKLSKTGVVDPNIDTMIRSISSMAFPCREEIVSASNNVYSIPEEKKTSIVALAKGIENDINSAVETIDDNNNIMTKLRSAETRAFQLSKLLGVKVKKSKMK